MTTYTVRMVNFGMNKGTFSTVDEAIAQANALGFEFAIVVNEPGKDSLHLCNQVKALGFECAIVVNEPGKDSLHLCNVKPY